MEHDHDVWHPSYTFYRKHEIVVLETETELSYTENALQVGAVVVGFDRYFNYYKIQ